MTPDRPTFLTLLDYEPVVAALTAILFPSTLSLELDVPKNWIRRPRRIRAGHALGLTCRRSYESFAPAIYRSIRVHTWTPPKPVVRGMLPISRQSVRTLDAELSYTRTALPPLRSFLSTLPRLEHLKIARSYSYDDASTALTLSSDDVPPSLRHLTLHFDDTSMLDRVFLTGQAAARLETLGMHHCVPRSSGVLPNVKDLTVYLKDNAPMTPARGATDWLPALERVYVHLAKGFWQNVAVMADWAAGISRPVLVYVKATMNYIPYDRLDEIGDSAADFHLGDPAGSLDLYDWGQAELTSDTTVIFVWLGSGRIQHKPDAHFVLRYEYKFADRRWYKTLKVYPRFEHDPIWSRWDEWEMSRNWWHQLEQIEARDEL